MDNSKDQTTKSEKDLMSQDPIEEAYKKGYDQGYKDGYGRGVSVGSTYDD